ITPRRSDGVDGAALERLPVEAAGAVRGADQRAGHDPGEPQLLGLLAQLDELLRPHPPRHGVVPRAGPQVLGDGEQVAAHLAQVAHRLHDLLGLLAQAEDEVGLRHQARLVRDAEHLQRALVPEGRADAPEDARHGLDVVREHLRLAGEHLLELGPVGVEVGHEQLDAAPGHHLVDLPGGLRVQPRPAVRQVVAGDAGDGRVAQAHAAHRLGHPARLVDVVLGGLAGVDLAEVAPARALVAADEEGRLPVLPALGDVGTAGLLADGVQVLLPDQGPDLVEVRPVPQPGLDPLRLALDRGLTVSDFQTEELAALGGDGHAALLVRAVLSVTSPAYARPGPARASARRLPRGPALTAGAGPPPGPRPAPRRARSPGASRRRAAPRRR